MSSLKQQIDAMSERELGLFLHACQEALSGCTRELELFEIERKMEHWIIEDIKRAKEQTIKKSSLRQHLYIKEIFLAGAVSKKEALYLHRYINTLFKGIKRLRWEKSITG